MRRHLAKIIRVQFECNVPCGTARDVQVRFPLISSHISMLEKRKEGSKEGKKRKKNKQTKTNASWA